MTKELPEIAMSVDDADDVELGVVIAVNDDVIADAMKPIAGIFHVVSPVSNSWHGTQFLDRYFDLPVKSVCGVRIVFVDVPENVSKIVQSRRRVL